MPRAKRPLRRRLAVLLFFGIASLLGSELALRTYLLFRPLRLRPDERLGWRCAENVVIDSVSQDAAGVRAALSYSTNALGFRLYDRLSEKDSAPRHGPRVLVIGDSFTQAAAVSNDRTYSGLLRKEIGAEVFAYGAGGYGTLQELMILESHVDSIDPDVVLWQGCTNDFINNDEGLERASRIDNNGMRRPYWQGGKVVYATPKDDLWLRDLGQSSRLVYLGLAVWDRVSAPWGHTVERDIEEQGFAHEGFARSLATTTELLGRVRARSAPRRVVSFCVDDPGGPYYEGWQRACARAGIEFVDGIPQALLAAEQKGQVTRAADRAHWNETGHEIAARVLGEWFRAHPQAASAATKR